MNLIDEHIEDAPIWFNLQWEMVRLSFGTTALAIET
jgi:hypothetical protein